MTTVIGIDPGKNETGIVVRNGDNLQYACVVDREDQSDQAYIIDVLETIQNAQTYVTTNSELIAVEGLIAPDEMPWLGKKHVGPIIGTAIILGAVLATYPGAVIVPPGGTGAGPFAGYPEAIRPTGLNPKGFDIMRHLRSAWDIAIAGERLAKLHR